ncbi:MAG: metal ABC transporter ATP-binding protein [Halobacteria archaeon]|nr:metal ABC transporter ATP-binding protein [Halobacteria archaeon]
MSEEETEGNVIEAQNVTYSYTGDLDTPAVENVSLSIEEGDFLGLVGPNGSGKTTLLKLMLGLLRPDRGDVYLFGEPAHRFDDGGRIGYVSQKATSVGKNMPVTVREAVKMGRYSNRRFGPLGKKDKRKIDEAMNEVSIEDIADKRVDEISGGQKQRTFIARALASEADLLALDEPTIGVDARSRENFYGLLNELNDNGITIVLIEHDIGVVTQHVNKITCINRRIYYHGDPEEFAESDALTRTYGADHQVIEHDHTRRRDER